MIVLNALLDNLSTVAHLNGCNWPVCFSKPFTHLMSKPPTWCDTSLCPSHPPDV